MLTIELRANIARASAALQVSRRLRAEMRRLCFKMRDGLIQARMMAHNGKGKRKAGNGQKH